MVVNQLTATFLGSTADYIWLLPKIVHPKGICMTNCWLSLSFLMSNCEHLHQLSLLYYAVQYWAIPILEGMPIPLVGIPLVESGTACWIYWCIVIICQVQFNLIFIYQYPSAFNAANVHHFWCSCSLWVSSFCKMTTD